jgi:hypothetical protein
MPPEEVPQPVRDLAEARAVARRARDWATADRLRGEIEAAGWRVIDAASLYSLERAAPPDVVGEGTIRYGSSASVPSRLHDEPVGVASVVVVAEVAGAALALAVRALAEHAPDGTQLIIVANAPADADGASIRDLDLADPGSPGVGTDVVWTSARLGFAAALNAGIRRAAAPVVILLGPGVEPAGDVVSPLVSALEDPSVAVAGPFGLVSQDMQRFEDAPEALMDVVGIGGGVLAFRRADHLGRGPLDEHFVVPDDLGLWWSLVLRDTTEDDDVERQPRRAVQVRVPATRPPTAVSDAARDQQQARHARRNRYRVLKRFATRRDLLVGG